MYRFASVNSFLTPDGVLAMIMTRFTRNSHKPAFCCCREDRSLITGALPGDPR
jgi:hypothetical protein